MKVYVYEEDEIDGIKVLLYGRDGNVKPESHLKGQWGTHVRFKFLYYFLGCSAFILLSIVIFPS